MSTSTLCQNCQVDAAGEEICPGCFAPQVQRPARYTLDVTLPSRGPDVTPVANSVDLPELQTASFRPSSRLSRNLTKMRGGIATGLVLVVLALVALFLGFRNEKIQANEADLLATAAFEEGKYEEAARLWVKAAEHYDSLYDETAQAAALSKSSEAYLADDLYQESLELIEQSGTLTNTTYADKQAEIYLTWGDYNLEESRQYLSVEGFEDALAASQDASEHYQLGQGSNEQLAAALRGSARALAELQEFSEAREQVNKAVDLEGKTKSNIEVSKALTRRQIAYEKSRLAAAKENRYISDEEIPVIAVERPVRQTRRARSRDRSRIRRSQRRRAEANRPSVGKTEAYPTGQRRYRGDRDRDRKRRHRRDNFSRAPRAPIPRQPSDYKAPKKKYKQSAYPGAKKRRTKTRRKTTWSGVKTRPMGGSSRR